MRSCKIVGLIILSIFIIAYLGFLFVLPNFIDLNQYSDRISNLIEKNSDLQVNLENLKIKTSWNLSAGAIAEKIDLSYKEGEKFAQINNFEVKISLLTLLRKRIRISDIKADKFLINLDTNEKGDFLLKSYFNKNTSKELPLGLKFSNRMPSIFIKKYRFSILNKENDYSFKGDNLSISDFRLNRKIKLKTKGELVLNKHKQIVYDVSIISKLFPKGQDSKNDFIKIFEDLYTYSVNANIKTVLNIQENNTEGNINIDKISFIFANKLYPESNLKLIFKGNQAKINASLHADKYSKAIITGICKFKKNKFIDLHVITDRMNIKDFLLITKAMARPFGLKNIKDYDADGILKADFKVKSDFKKVESDGYLKINNASIKNKLYNVALSSVNANIDFSGDSIHIRQANAKLNNEPITVSGAIDKNAYANIVVLADKLQLKGVLLALGNTQILKENDILNGDVNIKATLNGYLNKANPQINIVTNNLNIKNKKSKSIIKISKILINKTCDKKIKNTAQVSGLKINANNMANITCKKVDLKFDDKNLNIPNTFLYVNNIKTNLSGDISNLNSTPKLNNLSINIPSQISVPIEGYPKAHMLIKGGLDLSGNLYNPNITGEFTIPLINIPSNETILKNISLNIGKQININCPYLKIADSSGSLIADIDKDFSKGIIARNVNLKSNYINLNSIISALSTSTQNSNATLTIINGHLNTGIFTVGKIIASNITSNLSSYENIFYLNNLRGSAYFGKIGGNINYDTLRNKVYLHLQGRGLNAAPALTALIGDYDINGRLDFDSNVNFTAYSVNEILHSLKGNTNFIISNGKMGVLGKFEHLLYAQNILSNSVFKATLNVVVKAITVKNTGVYRYMKGKIVFSNGWANILMLKTSGPSMSLYITGREYMPEDIANLTILGRISDDIVRILGPIGEFSMNKVISSIPQLGEINSFFAEQITSNPAYENISQIPPLTPQTEFKTKEFKVIIDGNIMKQSSVKSFKWLSKPRIINNTLPQNSVKEKNNTVPDFIQKLPDLKK